MNKKTILMVSLCVGIAVMAIAYAAFSATLNVNGTVQSTGNFSVIYSEGSSCVGTKVGADMPTGQVVVMSGSTTANLSVKLYTPGDVVTCTIPVTNAGNIVASFDGQPVISNGLNASTQPISVEAKNPENDSIDVEYLSPGTTENITVVIKYNWNQTSQPNSGDLNKIFTITSKFVQRISY